MLPPIPQFPRENDVYMPTTACPFRAAAEPRAASNRNAFRALMLLARTRPGVSEAQAREDVARAGRSIAAEHPDVTPLSARHRADALPLQERLTSGARPTLLLLTGTALLVLVLACANVANLSLARQLRREQELAVRISLGATRGHIARLALAEAALLAAAGGALGVVLAYSSLDLLVAFASRLTPRAAGVSLDVSVLAFAAAVSLASALATAAWPLVSGRVEARRALAEAARGATAGRPRMRLRGALIAAQVAVSLTLLAAAGLMLRSLQRLQQVDPGFDAEQVLTAEIPLNWSRFTSAADSAAFFAELLRRLEAIPGVSAAAVGSTAPLSGTPPQQVPFQVEGRPPQPGELPPLLELRFASPAYFQTLGIPLLRGRTFAPGDGQGAPDVAIVNRSLARRYWPDADPLGARLSTDGGSTWWTVVGVAGDVRQHGLDREAAEELYRPVFQAGVAGGLFARTPASGSGRIAAAIKEAVHGLAPDQPVMGIRPMTLQREEAVASPRLTATLLGLFAGLALVVTALGLGGLIAYSVAQRRREIGVRMALGARPGQVLGLVLVQGLRLVALGAVLGLAGAVALGRSMRSLLFETAPADPLALSAAAALLLAVATFATLLPARRASRIDPTVALRDA